MSRFESPATGMYNWTDGVLADLAQLKNMMIQQFNEIWRINNELIALHKLDARKHITQAERDENYLQEIKLNAQLNEVMDLHNQTKQEYEALASQFRHLFSPPKARDPVAEYITLWPLYHETEDLLREGQEMVDQIVARETQSRNEAAEALMKLSAATMGKMASVKTGSAVKYTEAKSKNVLQAIWFAIKDLSTEDPGSILSILREALDLVVRPVKSLAEREGKLAGIQFLTQIYRTLKQMVAAGLRAIMESVGITSALGGDIYVAMHKLADALADTPRVEKILNDAEEDGDTATSSGPSTVKFFGKN